jgi:hypothetical protein
VRAPGDCSTSADLGIQGPRAQPLSHTLVIPTGPPRGSARRGGIARWGSWAASSMTEGSQRSDDGITSAMVPGCIQLATSRDIWWSCGAVLASSGEARSTARTHPLPLVNASWKPYLQTLIHHRKPEGRWFRPKEHRDALQCRNGCPAVATCASSNWSGNDVRDQRSVFCRVSLYQVTSRPPGRPLPSADVLQREWEVGGWLVAGEAYVAGCVCRVVCKCLDARPDACDGG